MRDDGPEPLSPDFRRLAWSNLAAQSGEQIALAAAPMVAVLALGAGAGETGLLQTVLTLPFLLFAIPAGLLADCLERRRLMAQAEALRAAALLALLALVTFDALTWPLPAPALAGLAFFILGAGPILWVISTTTLRQVVTPQRLLGRVSAINIMSYGARPLGAGLGALIGGLYGVESCLIAAVAFFLWQALIIAASPAVRLRAQPQVLAVP